MVYLKKSINSRPMTVMRKLLVRHGGPAPACNSIHAVALLLLFACPSMLAAQSEDGGKPDAVADERARDYEDPSFIKLPLAEPSGICYLPKAGRFWIVSDDGNIGQFDRSFKQTASLKINGDIEGVSFHPSIEEVIYIAVEDRSEIIEYNTSSRRALRVFTIDFEGHAEFRGTRRGNKGVEGIVLIPGSGDAGQEAISVFAVVEAKPARLIRLSIDVGVESVTRRRAANGGGESGVRVPAPIANSFSLPVQRMSDVGYDPETGLLHVVSAADKKLVFCDKAGKVARTIAVPGRKPEGVVVLPDRSVVVVQDTGGAWLCPDILNQ